MALPLNLILLALVVPPFREQNPFGATTDSTGAL